MILTETINTAVDLASRGDYRAAIEMLGDRWPGVGVEPERHGDRDTEFAQLLCVCGILTVELGSMSAAPLQAPAKDLLSKAARLCDNDTDALRARYWLAVAYLRCGENHEALAVVDALLAEQSAESDVTFLAAAVKGLACLNLGRIDESEQAFESVAGLMSAVSPITQGRYLLNRGMLYRQTDRLDDAIACYEQAITALEIAGSLRLQAAARNNIAGVLMQRGLLDEAHASAAAALELFVKLRDLSHQAKVWDQRARIYSLEQNYVEMERCAARAVEILSAGDHDGWLAEALITHADALAKLGMQRARGALSRALEICDRLTDGKQGRVALDALWKLVKECRTTSDATEREILPVEKKIYQALLAANNGRITPTAHALGYTHQVFQRRLETYFPDLLNQRRQKWRRRKSLFKK